MCALEFGTIFSKRDSKWRVDGKKLLMMKYLLWNSQSLWPGIVMQRQWLHSIPYTAPHPRPNPLTFERRHGKEGRFSHKNPQTQKLQQMLIVWEKGLYFSPLSRVQPFSQVLVTYIRFHQENRRRDSRTIVYKNLIFLHYFILPMKQTLQASSPWNVSICLNFIR